MARFLWICAGGALGTGARYLLSLWAVRTLGPAFPWGTIAVNVAGSFLIVLLARLGLDSGAVSPDVRLVLTTGIMGGFTTYSSFNYETLLYFERGAWGLGAANMAATIIGCLLAGALGLLAARGLTAG